MKTIPRRALIACVLLLSALACQLVLGRMNETERPPLKRPLSSIPFAIGDWSGQDETVDPDILERSQATDYLSRVYECPRFRGRKMRLWINYSRKGDNLRHTPEICLPSAGRTKIESRTRVITLGRLAGRDQLATLLAYARGDLVENVGFWYYIFGEGRLENYVRRLPITSRSSHGRTTRGSSITIEVFSTGEDDPEGNAMIDFARGLLAELEPILPESRAEYYIP